LMKNGKAIRGVLGTPVEDVTPELAEKLNLKVSGGALISRVLPGSPAAAAGIKAGDVIVAANGAPVRKGSDFTAGLALGFIGHDANVTVLRDGKEQKYNLKYADVPRDRTKFPVLTGDRRFSNLVLGGIEPGLPLYGELMGAFVSDIKDGPLRRAGVTTGDVITGFDDISVRSPMQALQAIELLPGIQTVQIVRNGAPYRVRLEAPQ
jgi:serine protease Do